MANMSQNAPLLPGRAALHGTKAATSANPNGGKPGFVFSEMAHLGKLNLRADKTAAKAVKSVTGCAFPPDANRFTAAGERRVVWLSPDEYLIICEAGKDDDILGALNVALKNRHYAVNNISDALTAFKLSGPASRQVLAKGCALDLHPKQFVAGDCAQSLLSHAGITLLALSDHEFIILCRTSFAAYMHAWLFDAALEFGVTFKT
jgi:sarcosine oxidase subunit gamma